jgi:hypothetical protein
MRRWNTAAKKFRAATTFLQFWVQYKQELGNARSKFHHVTTSQSRRDFSGQPKARAPMGQPLRYHGATLLEFDEMGLIKFFPRLLRHRELKVKAAPETRDIGLYPVYDG